MQLVDGVEYESVIRHAGLGTGIFNARTFNKFTSQKVSDALIMQLYDLMKWGPTSMNSQPGHYVFIKSQEAKQRIKSALMPGNQDKTMAARMMGLDCGTMSGFNNQAVDAEFFPDGRYKSNFLINIGCGDASGDYPRGPRLAFADVVDII